MKDFSTSNLVGAVIPNRPCLISKTLQRLLRSLGEGESSARFTETERSRATSSIALILSLLLVSSCLAWDEEEFESKPFHQSNFNQRSSVIDYGYKNTYQANPSHLTSVIDYGGPKRLAQENDYVAPKQLRTQIDQDPIERQNRQMDEMNAHTKRMYEEQSKKWDKLQAKQEAENDEWEAQQWRDVETVAGAFVASGPYYKAGQRMVQTDKGLVYSTGNGCVIAPDGFYFRSGKLWVGPNGKLAGQSGSGNNQYIWGNDGDSAISAGRGYFTDRGYSWPAYPEPVYRNVTSTMRKP